MDIEPINVMAKLNLDVRERERYEVININKAKGIMALPITFLKNKEIHNPPVIFKKGNLIIALKNSNAI